MLAFNTEHNHLWLKSPGLTADNRTLYLYWHVGVWCHSLGAFWCCHDRHVEWKRLTHTDSEALLMTGEFFIMTFNRMSACDWVWLWVLNAMLLSSTFVSSQQDCCYSVCVSKPKCYSAADGLKRGSNIFKKLGRCHHTDFFLAFDHYQLLSELIHHLYPFIIFSLPSVIAGSSVNV